MTNEPIDGEIQQSEELIGTIAGTSALTGMLMLGGGGIVPQTFLDLTDTPSTYSGQAGLYPRVNPGEDALIFDTAAGATGPAGADGLSAYEVALVEGFVGTQAAWLASLVGADGPQGPMGSQGATGDTGADGLSAYQVALANGFVGTESEWLASLVGPEGPPGTGAVDSVNGATGAVVLDADDIDDTATLNKFATAAELAAIASAVQPGDLATVATTGAYADLTGTPTIPATFDDLTDGTTNKAFTGTLKTKLDGIEALADVTGAANVAGVIDGAAEITTPTGNFAAVVTGVLNRITWANIQTYLSTLYQGLHANLTALAGLTGAADKGIHFTGVGATATHDLTAYGRSLLASAAAANARTTLGLIIGTDVQAQDAELQAIAGLTSAADKMPYFTGIGTASVADLSAFARTLIDDADAATMRATLGLDAVYEAIGATATHAALTATHGVTGAVVGTTDAQTLTNKTLDSTNISTLTAKTTPVDADSAVIVDSAATNVFKSVTYTNIKAFLKTYFDTLYNVGPAINAATAKGGVADGDFFGIVDSQDGNAFKKLSWNNMTLVLASWFDTQYQFVNANLTALSSFSTAANKLPYFTGSGTADVTDLSAYARTLIDDADAATARTTLGLGTIATAAASAYGPLASANTWAAAQTFSSGITFGGATLSNHTEGSWTPGISFGGGTTGITYSLQVGRYIRIGNEVTVWGRVTLTNKGSSTGDALITGMPFAPSIVTGLVYNASVYTTNMTYTGTLMVFSTTTTDIILQANSGGAASALSNTAFANNTVIAVTMTYRTG